ncbi:hypothetical protein WAZ07_01045 [Bacillus sp. FJAT-51639]|uniref:Uncharacterized protein n=1 Tax=Bacillus bruguierae TaxID=3127667 RepID=A0ABU8FB63_9BACI
MMMYLGLFMKIGLPTILALLNLHQWLYNKKPKYYFWFKRIFSKWRDTKWSIHANYKIPKDLEVYRFFEESVDEIFSKKDRVVNLPNKKQYNFGDFSLLVLYNLDFSNTDLVTVDINLNPVNVTYTNADEKLSELRRLFITFERKINCSNPSYNMDIHFAKKTNPFYGLMIQRLGPENVDYFECKFNLSTLRGKETDQIIRNNKNLRVFKEKITINENSFDIIEEIAKDILLMR